MQFDSAVFLVFLPLVFVLAHMLRDHLRAQNALIVVASMVFYGWFDWRLSFLLLAYTLLAYQAALRIEASHDERTRLLWLRGSVTLCLAGLGFFKYAGFVVENVSRAMQMLGLAGDPVLLEILLPIGISFYCFQAIAYIVDVYRGEVRAERDPITFAAFKFFFPLLVAGPIERARHLLVQFQRPRTVTRDQATCGLWLVVWGLFLKVVCADTLAGFVARVWPGEPSIEGWAVLGGAIAFTLQIYFDFNAYSVIAKGVAALFGVELVWNFERPYWSTSVQEFWRRWHVSLSTWLRDYLYVPLGGNRKGELRTYLNLMLTMVLGGLWHGAAWTFILWGTLHGAALCVQRLWSGWRTAPRVPVVVGWFLTMAVVTFGLFIFRSPDLAGAGELLSRLGHFHWTPFDRALFLAIAATTAPVLLVEALQLRRADLMAPARVGFGPFSVVTGLLVAAIFVRFSETAHDFVYFQF